MHLQHGVVLAPLVLSRTPRAVIRSRCCAPSQAVSAVCPAPRAVSALPDRCAPSPPSPPRTVSASAAGRSPPPAAAASRS